MLHIIVINRSPAIMLYADFDKVPPKEMMDKKPRIFQFSSQKNALHTRAKISGLTLIDNA